MPNEGMNYIHNSAYCLISNDVETHSIWFNTLRDETGIKVYKEVMPRILEIYNKYEIKASFFYTGHIAKLIPDIVKMVVKDGHEVGCHGLVHNVDKAFDILPLKDQISHLKEAKKILEDISGNEVISFRAPALRVNKNTPIALVESGFKIDSSISPQRMDLLLSFGSWNKVQRLFSPRKPYLTKKDNLAKKGDGPIIEVPLSSFLLPLVGSIMRAFPQLNSVLRKYLTSEAFKKHIPIVTYSHPNEFLSEGSEDLKYIYRRANNILKYYLADVIRRNLKIKNLGPHAFNLYINQIKYFSNKGFKFITIKEYCEIKKLLK